MRLRNSLLVEVTEEMLIEAVLKAGGSRANDDPHIQEENADFIWSGITVEAKILAQNQFHEYKAEILEELHSRILQEYSLQSSIDHNSNDEILHVCVEGYYDSLSLPVQLSIDARLLGRVKKLAKKAKTQISTTQKTNASVGDVRCLWVVNSNNLHISGNITFKDPEEERVYPTRIASAAFGATSQLDLIAVSNSLAYQQDTLGDVIALWYFDAFRRGEGSSPESLTIDEVKAEIGGLLSAHGNLAESCMSKGLMLTSASDTRLRPKSADAWIVEMKPCIFYYGHSDVWPDYPSIILITSPDIKRLPQTQ